MKNPSKKQIEEAFKNLEDAKKAYKEWDQILTALIANNIEAVKTKSGTFQVVDVFLDKTIVWKPVAMKRFELKKVA